MKTRIMKTAGMGFWRNHVLDRCARGRAHSAALLSVAVVALCGCNITTERTVVQTPAVYMGTNLVQAAQSQSLTKKERLWLPAGYAVHHDTMVHGIQVSMTDAASQTPKVQAGIVNDAWWWIPTGTNDLFAPPLTANAMIDNKAVPFLMKARGGFTSGKVMTSQADTNSTSAAIVPGTPPLFTPLSGLPK